MTIFLQVLLTGLGLGAAYALFAQGVVLIYRGSGIVNFAQGALGMLASYITFLELSEKHGYPIGVCIAGGILASVAVALAFQFLVLRLLSTAAPIVRLISTLGLLVVVQSAIELRVRQRQPPRRGVPARTTRSTGAACSCRSRCSTSSRSPSSSRSCCGRSAKYSRIGLAITAAAQNERAVQTMGWSPNRLAVITWGMGAALAGIAGVLLAPLTGLSTLTFTLIVTVTAMAAALLGGFRSFPLTLVGGFVIGIGEAAVVRYRFDIENFLGIKGGIPGIERAIPFLLILLVLVIRGRGLPLRSHVSDRLPKLGTGRINVPGILLATGIVVILLIDRDGRPVGDGDLHLRHLRHRRPLDRRAHRLRRSALAGAVGPRGHGRADRRESRAPARLPARGGACPSACY